VAEKGDSEMQALTLAGGIKGWVNAGEEYTRNVDGYDAEYWKQFE
jgi:arsenical-resistance protein 2